MSSLSHRSFPVGSSVSSVSSESSEAACFRPERRKLHENFNFMKTPCTCAKIGDVSRDRDAYNLPAGASFVVFEHSAGLLVCRHDARSPEASLSVEDNVPPQTPQLSPHVPQTREPLARRG